ncbi:MAG: hypothetical protein O7H41_02660 [Planctomycetota bacterium]|nr:hypothetical protein [Planctomycetota bacterium]
MTSPRPVQRSRAWGGVAPILFKDFTIVGRRPWTYRWRVIGIGLVSALFLWVLSWMWRWSYLGIPNAMSMVSRSLVSTVTVCAFIIVSMAVPAAIIGGVSEERERGTLGLLLASPIGARGVAVGKTLAALLRTGVWCLGVVPLLFVTFAFGGVEAGAIVRSLAHVAAGGLLAAGIALIFLGTHARGARLLIGTYSVLVLYTVIPLVLAEAGALGGGTRWLSWVFKPMLLWQPLLDCIDSMDYGMRGSWRTPVWGPLGSVGIGCVWVALGTVIFARGLRREGSPGQAALPLERSGKSPPPGDHPVYWYETQIRQRRQSRRIRVGSMLARLCLLPLSFLLAVVMTGVGRGNWLSAGCIIYGFCLLGVVLILAVVRGAWSGGDPRTELPLLVAPIPEGQIALEKIAAIVRASLMPVILIALLLVGGVYLDPRPYMYQSLYNTVFGLSMGMISVLMGTAVLGALSALIARAYASATRGIVATFTIFIGQAIGIPFAFGIAGHFDEGMFSILSASNPLFFVAVAIFDTGEDRLGYLVMGLLLAGMLTVIMVGITARNWAAASRRKI